MNSIRFYKITVIILIMLNVGTLIFLWVTRPGVHEQNRRREPVEFMIRELRLTPDQREKFKLLRKEHLGQLKHLRKLDRELHDRFFDALFLPVPDTVIASQYADSMIRVRKEMEMLTFRHFQHLQTLLDENQKIRFRQVFRNALDKALPAPPDPPEPPPAGQGRGGE